MRLLLVFLALLVFGCCGAEEIDKNGKIMRILALFSGTKNDLGIDHRLGRQVLKLSVNRARELHPNLTVELMIHYDETDCTSSNQIPNRVAEYFYLSEESRSLCHSKQLEGACNEAEEDKVAESYLQEEKKRQVDAIIGPSCDFLVDLVARMAAYWHTPIYSTTSIAGKFARKDIYSTLTRLSPSIDQLALFIFSNLERFKWRHVAFLVDQQEPEMEIMARSLDRTINKLRFKWPVERKLFGLTNSTKTINSANLTGLPPIPSQCSEETRQVLLEARKVARIFLLLLNEPFRVRKLLLCAHELRMNNGEFVFLALQLSLRSTGQSVAVQPPEVAKLKQINQTGSEEAVAARQRSASNRASFDWYSAEDERNNLFAREMFESLLVFSVELPTSEEYNLFVEQALDMAHQEFPEVRFDRAGLSSVAAALHDSLLLAVEAHQQRLSRVVESSREKEEQFISEDSDERLGIRRKVRRTALMWNKRFSAGLIPNMHINANGDQELDYLLSDLEPETGLMRPVAIFSKQSRNLELLPGSYIHWPLLRKTSLSSSNLRQELDSAPPDEPECGFNDDAERCVDRQNLYAILLVVLILFLLATFSIAFSHYQYKRIKYQQQLDDYCWRINWDELQFVQMTDSLASSTPGSVARALRAGASVISAGASEVGSMVSLSMRGKQKPLPEGQTEEAKSNVVATTSRPPPLILTSMPTQAIEESDNETNFSQAPTGSESKAPSGGSVLAGGVSCQLSPQTATGKQESVVGSSYFKSDYSSVVRRSMLAMYRNELIILKQLNGNNLDVTRELLVELRSMRELLHDNLAKFIGLCLEPNRLSIAYEFCSRGSLQEILLNDSIVMDWTLKYSIIGDIVNGLNFIHTTLLGFHGRLKSTNLVLDSRFTVKLTDFGLQSVYSQLEPLEVTPNSDEEEEEDDGEETDRARSSSGKKRSGPRSQQDQLSLSVSQAAYNMESVSMRGENLRHKANRKPMSSSKSFSSSGRSNMRHRASSRYFWTAPEHLRENNVHFAGSKKGDIYALAIILSEIFTRKEPYHYGTTAKPHWPTIKKEKARTVASFAAASGSNRAGSEVSGSAGRSLISSANRRPSSKVIRHTQINQVEPAAPGEPLSTSGVRKRINSTAIEEEGVVEEEQQQSSKPASLVAGGAEEEQLPATSRKSELTNTKELKESSPSRQQKIDAEEILDQLRMGLQPEPVRPYLPNYVLQEISGRLIELMRLCWSESAPSRPSIQQVRSSLRKITKGVASKNYLDNLLDRLQNYAADLERIVDSKSCDILEEKNRTDELLYQLVPKFVAYKLKRNEPIIPQLFDGVTIFFSDIIGFEKYASVMSPSELVDLLNSIYSSFDSIINSFDVTKIETIIDQFLVASGISLQAHQEQPEQVEKNQIEEKITPPQAEVKQQDSPQKEKERSKRGKFKRSHLIRDSLKRTSASMDSKGLNQSQDSAGGGQPTGSGEPAESSYFKRSSAEQIARMAICIRDLVKSFHFPRQTNPNSNPSTNNQNQFGDGEQMIQQRQFALTSFNIRIGIHSGRVCAGIVGLKRPKFCLIGDTVNVASRMHTNSKANKIQISDATRQLLENVPGLTIEPRGKIEVKGKGLMETYWLESSY